MLYASIQGSPVYTNCPLSTIEELTALREGGTDDDLHIHACQQIWGKKLSDGTVATVFVNFDSVPVNLTCGPSCFTQLGLPASVSADFE